MKLLEMDIKSTDNISKNNQRAIDIVKFIFDPFYWHGHKFFFVKILKYQNNFLLKKHIQILKLLC